MRENEYPYSKSTFQQGVEGECLYRRASNQYKIARYRLTSSRLNDCVGIIKTIKLRTVAIAITAGNDNFRFYSNGVINVCGTTEDFVDHAVSLVGYYYDEKRKYWKIKNSWGVNWGEAGYVRIDNSMENVCSVCFLGSYAMI